MVLWGVCGRRLGTRCAPRPEWRLCAETGVEDVVSIVADFSYQAELTVQPGHASIGLVDPDAFRVALEEIVPPLDV